MGGVFLCPTPAKACRAVPEDASTFPRVLPPRPSRVRERFHGDIIVSLSFCAFARDAWTITEMEAGDDPGKERKSPARAREPGIERAMGVARRTPAPRPPLCVDRVRLPINIRSSSRVNRFESPHRGVAVESTNAPRSFEFLLIAIAARRARARRLSSFFSRAFRSSRSSVPSASPTVVFPVPRVVLPPLPPPRFPPRLASVSSPGRARCRDIAIFIRSFGWTRCSVLRVMTRECTRAQTTTSYDSRYMECTPVHSLAIVSTSRVGDDVRTTRATADEVTRRFHRQATATIERLRRAFESFNHRLAFASIRFRFAPSPTE